MGHEGVEPADPQVILGEDLLDLTTLLQLSRQPSQITIGEGTLRRVAQAHWQLVDASLQGVVYGANTGVGANRGVGIDRETYAENRHGSRLLHSHCAGLGVIEDDTVTRAGMIVRLNQILAGGSGVSRTFTEALLGGLNNGALPTLHRYGSIGTADLAQLAELALTLTGERPWRTGHVAPASLAATDALPFISSSALTIATAADAVVRMRELLAGAEVVAALSFLALRGSAQAWDPRVHRHRPHPEQLELSVRLSRLIAAERPAAERLQDPFCLRVVPQVHAPALHSMTALWASTEREVNAASENRLSSTATSCTTANSIWRRSRLTLSMPAPRSSPSCPCLRPGSPCSCCRP